jgi:hypothetical protein
MYISGAKGLSKSTLYKEAYVEMAFGGKNQHFGW